MLKSRSTCHIYICITFLLSANELCEGYVFTLACLSTGVGGGDGIPACLAGDIPACLAGLQGGLQAHTQRGGSGVWLGGIQAHTLG